MEPLEDKAFSIFSQRWRKLLAMAATSSNLKEAQALKQGNLVAVTKENLTPMIMLIRLI